jgi:hypothetical protein
MHLQYGAQNPLSDSPKSNKEQNKKCEKVTNFQQKCNETT